MPWRLAELVAFLNVVEAGSMTAAAARLNLSKSVVSKRIADLEGALGQELLRRSTRRVVPTDQGHALYDRMRPLLRELDEVIDSIAEQEGELRGRLRIAMPMSFGTLYLAPILLSFAREHPRLELALDLDDRMIDVVGGGYDVAIRIGWLEDSSLVARKLCVSKRFVCCSPSYAATCSLPSSLEELSGHNCIDYANVHTSRLWQFAPLRRGGRPRAVNIRSRIVANNGEAMRDAAIAGFGLVLLPDFLAASALREGTLIRVLPAEEPLPYTVAAVYPSTRHVPRKVRALVDYLASAFRGPPPWERSRAALSVGPEIGADERSLPGGLVRP